MCSIAPKRKLAAASSIQQHSLTGCCSCRARDVSKPASGQMPQSPLAMVSTQSYFSNTLPDIVPQRSPTLLRPLSLTLSEYDALEGLGKHGQLLYGSRSASNGQTIANDPQWTFGASSASTSGRTPSVTSSRKESVGTDSRKPSTSSSASLLSDRLMGVV